MEKEWKETGERFFTQSPSPSVRSSVDKSFVSSEVQEDWKV